MRKISCETPKEKILHLLANKYTTKYTTHKHSTVQAWLMPREAENTGALFGLPHARH